MDSYSIPKNLTLLGGEPFSHYNLDDLDYILSSIKSSRPSTKVLAWSGYEFYVLKSSPRYLNIIKNIDILVCGRFLEEYKCKDTTKMYGSENQYIVNVQESLNTGQTVYIEKGEQFLGLEEMRDRMKKGFSS